MNETSGRRGAFITVEGVDGAGKTTQMGFIEQWLAGRGIEVVRTREPGGTGLGERLRDLLVRETALDISAHSELMLVFAARRQHLEERILPALESGRWVISDRFTDATYAYQGAGRGIDADRIEKLEQWVQEGLTPDLTLVLDLPPEAGMARSGRRGGATDRFEDEAMAFKRAVRECYLDRAARYADRMRVVDAGGSVAAVQQEISNLLQDFLTARGGH